MILHIPFICQQNFLKKYSFIKSIENATHVVLPRQEKAQNKMSRKQSSLLGLYNQRLKEAEGIFAAEPAPLKLQSDTIKGLSDYVSALGRMAGDSRHQIYAVRELLDDIGSHLPWTGSADMQGKAIDQANRELRHMTARQPIRFTRLLLGGERGPADSTFLPGLVTQADELLATDFFDDMNCRYGSYEKWPALCTVYTGGGRGHYFAALAREMPVISISTPKSCSLRSRLSPLLHLEIRTGRAHRHGPSITYVLRATGSALLHSRVSAHSLSFP